MEELFAEFERIVRALRDQGSTLCDEDALCLLLMSLPSSYKMVVTAISTIENPKIDFVKAKLLDEEIKMKG